VHEAPALRRSEKGSLYVVTSFNLTNCIVKGEFGLQIDKQNEVYSKVTIVFYVIQLKKM
jgi:hypothetical protein